MSPDDRISEIESMLWYYWDHHQDELTLNNGEIRWLADQLKQARGMLNDCLKAAVLEDTRHMPVADQIATFLNGENNG